MNITKGRVILAAIAAAAVVLAIYVFDLTRFPGNIKDPGYGKQITTTGAKSTFQEGVVYRHPGVPPMIELKGDYYEMGLQYGVLLRPELVGGMDALCKILKWNAEEMGVPLPAMTALIKLKARGMADGLPKKYRDEMLGVADGSGVPYDAVISICLMYDIGMGMDCTGVLMRGRNGSIIQGRNNDSAGFGGEELAKMTVVVRHRAHGANAVTHMDVPYFYMGVETGYNDRGLCFGEETLWIKKPNPGGFSLPYLIRMILEEASSIDEIYPYFDKHKTIAAYGCVWSDLKSGRGVVVELTPTAWARNELKGSLLWNFNRIYDPGLAGQQLPRRNLTNINIDREAIAGAFPKKREYTVADVVNFVRAQRGPEGTDYSWDGTKFPVCNWMASQMMIFDSTMEGFYMAVGPYYAARQNIYQYFNDFSRRPELFMPAVKIEPLVEKAAQIENRLISKSEKLKAFIDLAAHHTKDANVHFLVAQKSFRLSKLDTFADYAIKAHAMKPDNDEYRIYAGMAAYHGKDPAKAVKLLEGATARYPELDLYRLTVLERACRTQDPPKAARYALVKTALLEKHEAGPYYKSKILPLIDALEKDQ